MVDNSFLTVALGDKTWNRVSATIMTQLHVRAPKLIVELSNLDCNK